MGTPGIMSQLCPDIGAGVGGGIEIAFGGTAGFGAAAGTAAAPGTGGTTGGTAAGGAGPSLVPCPSEAPIAENHQACEGPGVCPYVDGTSCSCEACDEGWCWRCKVASLPFGCPRVPPVNGESCPWTGALCNYGDGKLFDTTVAGCCLGEWRVVVNERAKQ
jgi:hypothetical protein